MKLSKAMQAAINEQIHMELASSYKYLGMSAWCEFAEFPGSAQWLRIQSAEETGHAMRLYKFLADRGARITLEALPAPQQNYKSLLDVFQNALKAEESVSESINKLYELSLKEKAFSTAAQLQWFLTEQVEEEATCRKIVAVLERIKDDVPSLLEYDRFLGSRSEGAEEEEE
ncbi:MAG: ferritin [Candidatus Sumerlaeaceae bacterium]|nr:ferritin [Candidatus Sumerlaeaceae bacterium]